MKYYFANAHIAKNAETPFTIGCVSPTLGMTIPNVSLALPMKKLVFNS